MFGKNLSGPKGLPPGNISVNVPAVRSAPEGEATILPALLNNPFDVLPVPA